MAKKRILLVDDEEAIQLLYREEFEDEGYLVDSARNGEEALAKFQIQPPDLVILDINMPGMNGIEVLRQMKEMRADLPVILSSAYQEYKQDFSTWASEAYVVKSANLDELKAVVREHLA
ncbi:response regulator [Desulfobulbus alkaliphilus]|uniref:response regulator n=1 Tax=Desulfobulbus alkaliphilus TaxID=869814 RepID=UPI00196688A2|nr:response regulator [Desulfobulbus alkaliphilus]